MKCGKCGSELPDNAEKCSVCGCEINADNGENSTPKKERKLLLKRSNESLAALIVPICAVLLIAAVLFLIVSSFVEINEEIEVEDYYVTVYDEKENVTYFLFKGKLVEGRVYGRCDDPYSDGSISRDGTVAAVKCESDSGSYMLFAVTPSGVKMVSDRVGEKDCSFVMSDDGEFLAYTLSSPGALYIYDVDTGKSEISVEQDVSEFSFVNNSKDVAFLTADNTLASLDVASGKIKTLSEKVKQYASLLDGARTVYLTEENTLFLYTDWSNSTETVAEDVTSLCTSIGKETFAYTANADSGKTDENGDAIITESFFRNGQKEVLFGANITPVALDDGGDNIYCTNEKGALLLYDKGGDVITIFEEKCDFVLSSSLTEIAYSAQDGIYLYSRKNGSAKISDSLGTTPIIKEGEEEISRFSDRFYTNENEDGTVTVTYVDAAFLSSPVIENASAIALSENGKALFAEKDSKIYLAEYSDGVKISEVCEGTLTEGEYYIADGGALYLKEKNEDETCTLYWCKDGKKTAVSEHVIGEIYMSHDDNLFFTENIPSAESENDEIFSVEGIKGYPLYCVKNGGEKVHITDNMCSIKMSKASAYIITPSADFDAEDNPSFSVYGCVRGNNFKLIIEDITILKK